jgi:hypothetical protein
MRRSRGVTPALWWATCLVVAHPSRRALRALLRVRLLLLSNRKPLQRAPPARARPAPGPCLLAALSSRRGDMPGRVGPVRRTIGRRVEAVRRAMLRRRSSSSSRRSSCRSVCFWSEYKCHLWRQSAPAQSAVRRVRSAGSLRGTVEAAVAEGLESVGPRQHRAVILGAFIPAVFLARGMGREAVVDRRLDPLAALALRLVVHGSRSLLGYGPGAFFAHIGIKGPCACGGSRIAAT